MFRSCCILFFSSCLIPFLPVHAQDKQVSIRVAQEESSMLGDFQTYLKLLELRDEDIYNSNRELNISETGWSYWFYKPEPEKHAYNRKVTPLDNGRIVCTKVIKQLYNVAESKVIRLKDVKTPLYLLFVAVAEYDASGKPTKELLRRKIRIEWMDEQ